MSTTSTAANQDDLLKDSNTISDNVTAEFTLIEGVDCPPAAEETPVTHTCISAEYENCKVFDDSQVKRLKTLQEWFVVTERHSCEKPVNRTERRKALDSVDSYTRDCKTSFEKAHGASNSILAEDSATLDCAERFVTSNKLNYHM